MRKNCRFASWGVFFLVTLMLTYMVGDCARAEEEPAPQSQSIEDILNLDIEQLAKVHVTAPSLDIPVTTVSKEPSTIGRSPAAVFVISNEMIRRSGVTCVPEALRMAPGVEVARINANLWAITARGFNARYSNKMLVLIDGRTVYSPAFGGVYWDTQNVLLEDVDRIEVIRGSGATLWGSNAVNGVINVISKTAGNSQGVYAMAGAGTADRNMEAARYGGRIGENAQYLVYGQYFERGPFYDPTNSPTEDTGRQGQGGFRTDWDIGGSKTDKLTVQGDTYNGSSGDPQTKILLYPPYSTAVPNRDALSGQNVLARWEHVRDEDSGWMVQTYYDYYRRGTTLYDERVGSFDVQFQYNFQLNDRNKILFGAECYQYHYSIPSTDPSTLSFTPSEGTETRNSQFIQDEIAILPDLLALTLGVRLEEDQFIGVEYQPTARLLYTPDKKHSIWCAASRAVHTPQVIDEYLSRMYLLSDSGLLAVVQGNSGMRSEVCWAYEIGYREQMTDNFSYDVATFYNVYDDLRSIAVGGPIMPPPPLILSAPFVNLSTADTYGVELATHYTVTERWRLMANYTFLQVVVAGDPTELGEGDSPKHQVYLRSSWDIKENVDFDLTLRYVDCLSRAAGTPINVPAYTTVDMCLAWRPRKHLELAVVGQNLLQSHHIEFGGIVEDPDTFITEVPRCVYGSVTWRY